MPALDAEHVADVRFGMAQALWDTGKDRKRARALAVEARAGYAGLGDFSKESLAEVDAWLAAHPHGAIDASRR